MLGLGGVFGFWVWVLLFLCLGWVWASVTRAVLWWDGIWWWMGLGFGGGWGWAF